MLRLQNPQSFHFLPRADVLRHSNVLCDAAICVDGHLFQAHRLVLACTSRALARLMSLQQDGRVQCGVQGVSARTFKQLLDYIYAQVVEVTEPELQTLLRGAQLLEMDGLEEQCKTLLLKLQKPNTETTNCITPAPKTGKEVKEELLICKRKETAEEVSEEKSHQKAQTLSQNPRDSVITSSVLSSPWTLPAHVWNSVSTLRHIAQNYSLMSMPNTLCSLSMPPHRVLLSSAFHRPARDLNRLARDLHRPAQAMSVPDFPSETGPLRAGSFIAQGLKRKKLKDRASRTRTQDRTSCRGEAKVDAGRGCQLCSSQPQGSSECRCPSAVRPGAQEPQHKPYQCQRCMKRFSLKHQLDTHLRVHTGEKPFECLLCGQRSRDYSAMVKHLRTHGGAAPYQCTVCLQFCSSLVNMQRHVKSHELSHFPHDWSLARTYMYRSHL
ncbi:unnamed protein product [Knipowitschia caucasica]|uniref:Zinc finger and BTB domain-containing protein 32 n=1 Tax=Knipowitschia caucasica TaxID=637954 RepID=A0AAV2MDN6_KNICA